jgi:hypothetical protein
MAPQGIEGGTSPAAEGLIEDQFDAASEGQVIMTRIDERSHSKAARWAAFAALLLLGTAMGGGAAVADTAIVQQDGTPIFATPTGHVVTRVDTGFELTVLARRGEWLEVTSPQLGSSGAFWVPAQSVGTIVATPAAPQFRIVGTDAAMTGPVEIVPTTSQAVIAPQFRIVEPTQSTALAVTAPVEVVPPAMQAGAIVPQFDNAEPMARNRTDVVVTTPSASAPAVAPQSNRTVSTRATPATRSTAVTAPATAAPAVSAPASNSVSISTGNVTPAVGNAVEAPATSNPSFGNPTPAFSGNPTPAFSSNPTTIGTQTNTAVTSGTRTTVTVR